MKKLTSISLLFFGITSIIIIIIMFFFTLGVVPSIIYLLLNCIERETIAFTFIFISLISFFLFLTEKKGKVIFFNIGIILLTFGIVEKSLTLFKRNPHNVAWVVTDTSGFNQMSDTLGTKLAKNFTDHSVSRIGDTVIFDVHYSTDENGWRKTPKINPNDSTKSIVFFGCSYLFGHGLNDSLVMPNMVQNLVQDKYKVYNFSYSGYGTNQMLANIENNIVDSVIKYSPKIFIYGAIEDHLNRISNYVGYGFHSPKYILDPQTKEVKYVGRFDNYVDNSGLFKQKIMNSEIYNLFKKKLADTTDVKLFVEMVKKSQQLLKKKFPASEFHVIFYNRSCELLGINMINALQKSGIIVHKASDIVPNFNTGYHQYCIHFPSELHPNGKLNSILAKYIVKNIMHLPTENVPSISNYTVNVSKNQREN